MAARAPAGLALYDVENVVAFCSAVLKRTLARSGGYLNQEQREDAHSYLVEQTLELAITFRPEGARFSQYLSVLLQFRLVDWYRDELGDSRSKRKRPEFVPIDSALHVHAPDELEDVLSRAAVG